jgi:pilin isopeptide linkage protein
VGQARNDENGDITFPQMNFTATGIYHFTVKELTPSGNCWQCDNNIFGVTVTVTNNNGLHAEVTYDTGDVPTFTNYYNRFMR